MAGQPRKRARLLAEKMARQTALGLNADPSYVPFGHLPVELRPVMPRPKQRAPAEPAEAPAPMAAPSHRPPARAPQRTRAAAPLVALNDEEAELFRQIRVEALRKTLALLRLDPEKVKDVPSREKLRLKQAEIAQAMLGLAGRVDGSVLKGQTSEQEMIGTLLDEIKGRMQ